MTLNRVQNEYIMNNNNKYNPFLLLFYFSLKLNSSLKSSNFEPLLIHTKKEELWPIEMPTPKFIKIPQFISKLKITKYKTKKQIEKKPTR